MSMIVYKIFSCIFMGKILTCLPQPFSKILETQPLFLYKTEGKGGAFQLWFRFFKLKNLTFIDWKIAATLSV